MLFRLQMPLFCPLRQKHARQMTFSAFASAIYCSVNHVHARRLPYVGVFAYSNLRPAPPSPVVAMSRLSRADDMLD